MDHVNTYKNPHVHKKQKSNENSPIKFKEIDRSKFLTIDELMEGFKPVEINGMKINPDTGEIIEEKVFCYN